MTLGDAFRRAKTSQFIKTITFSHTSAEELALWRTMADISSRLQNQPEAKKQAILDGLQERGWSLQPRENWEPHRKLLNEMLISLLSNAHRYDPLSEPFPKFLGHIRKEKIDDVSSFDFATQRLNQVREVAQQVLADKLPQISPRF